MTFRWFRRAAGGMRNWPFQKRSFAIVQACQFTSEPRRPFDHPHSCAIARTISDTISLVSLFCCFYWKIRCGRFFFPFNFRKINKIKKKGKNRFFRQKTRKKNGKTDFFYINKRIKSDLGWENVQSKATKIYNLKWRPFGYLALRLNELAHGTRRAYSCRTYRLVPFTPKNF